MKQLTVTILIAWLASVPIAGQNPRATPPAQGVASAARPWTMPRTPWGDPDLNGVWTNATTTPWERPTQLAAKEFFTEAEAAARDLQVEGAAQTANSGSQPEFYERGRTVRTRRTSLITDPPNGRLPPLSAEGQRRQDAVAAARRTHGDADTWLDRDLPERCLLYRGLPPSPSGQNNNYNIVQTPTYVALMQEHIHEVRMIYTDGRPHLSPDVRQWLGDSRGRWEGNTLVVDTTNFYGFDKYYFRIKPSIEVSDAYHIVERFTRTATDMIDYTFTAEDPKTFTRPFSGSLPMTKASGVQSLMFESACHEGNHGMVNILSAARAEEARKAGAPSPSQPK